ncbi:MAG: hypothetical protein M3X11_14450 [Acidobacteriota bacterium]|nr:hypothetical protein [Acidobacteriota bacterium]
MRFLKSNYAHVWHTCRAAVYGLLAAMLLAFSASSVAAQVPNLHFSTDGPGTSSYGDASSSDGALRGNVQFKFNGYISGGGSGGQFLVISRSEVKLLLTPSGTKFYRINETTKVTSFNRSTGDYPVVTYSTSDPSFNILTISNLKGYEDYAHSSAGWHGKMKVTLKFSKVAGVADRFRVEFTPLTPAYSPPPPVSGLISSATVKAGSNLILTVN